MCIAMYCSTKTCCRIGTQLANLIGNSIIVDSEWFIIESTCGIWAKQTNSHVIQ